jgi:uncharacterized protein YdeI (YjbR/CyaY-like superfamily)
MAPVTPDPAHIRAFSDAKSFEQWLAAHHDKAEELWLRIYKKGASEPSVSYAEALDVALCWGWIDGQKKSFDEVSFLQRFSPRGPKSIWSQRNTAHVERLIAAGRMTSHGLKHVEAAKADGRWQAAYAAASEMEIPDDLRAAIAADSAAEAMFERLNRQNRFALAFRIGNMKTPAGRQRKIAEFVAMLARGETLYPNGQGRGPRR